MYMWNSLKVTGLSLILIVVLSSTAGYALSKFRMGGKNKFIPFHIWNYGPCTDYVNSAIHIL